MGVQANIGDVFLIPLDDNGYAIGQIVDMWKEELYIAIFDKRVSKDETDPISATNGDPVILTLSLDGKLWKEHWRLVGNYSRNLDRFPKSNYKVRRDGEFYLESRDRTYTRPSTAQEANILQFRTVSSPMILEKAIKAHFGIGEWKPGYDELLAVHAFASSELT